MQSDQIMNYTDNLCFSCLLLLGKYNIQNMGNQAGCSKLCQKTPVIDHNPDDILITEYIVPCQICNSQFKHHDLKEHIDITHYATIREQSNGNVIVECLLCGKQTNDLVQHGKHITEKHPYADVAVEKKSKLDSQIVIESAKLWRKVQQWQLNKHKKTAAVRLQNEREFQIIKQIGTNQYQAAVDGVNYVVLKYIKQYRGADYDAELMEAELIWFNIFKQKRKCKYYFLDLQPGQRNILCKSFIFVRIGD